MSAFIKLPENWLQKLLPYLLIPVIAICILLAYFNPVVKGKVMYQSDLIHYRGMSKELVDYRKLHHEDPLWGTRMFSGMPHYQYGMVSTGRVFRAVDNVVNLGLPRPITHFFILFLGFYILLLALRLDPWLSGIGAMAFMFSSFFFVSIEAGHTSKINATAYMAFVIAGVILGYRGRIYLGAALTTLGMALEVNANHPQITFYLALILGFLVISRFIFDLKAKRIKEFMIASVVLLGCLGLGVFSNWSLLSSTLEYTQETIRGPEILKKDNSTVQIEKQIFEPRKKNGLQPNYAFQWSNGLEDVLTLASPYFAGGASGDNIGEGSETFEILKKSYGANIAKQLVTKYPTYWGSLPFTSGPVYGGAIVLFLFVLGMIILDNKYRWWVLGIMLLGILLSMGKNFLPLSQFFFNWVPMYSKFRAPSMMLIVAEFCLPFLAFLALHKFFKEGWNAEQKEKLKKGLIIAAGSTAGFLLLLIVIGPIGFSFGNEYDPQAIYGFLTRQKVQTTDQLIAQLSDVIIDDRISLFRKDALRGIAFILISGGLLFAYIRDMLKKPIVYAGLAVLIAVDLIPVDRRYVNDENFEDPKKIDRLFDPSVADNKILADRDPNYRVFNISVSTFQDANTSYRHKSIGGYHAAKLRRYQDLIENHLEKVPQQVGNAFNGALKEGKDPIEASRNALESQGPVNMLNAKYFIYSPNADPIVNPYALGNAWFINEIRVMNSEEEVMAALGTIDPGKTVLVNQDMAENVANFKPGIDSTASIKLISFDNKKLVYESAAKSEQLAVFSEIYYNSGKGWDAFIDGQSAKHFRVDYLLRAMRIPGGKHTIEFRFEPQTFLRGNKIAMIISLISLAIILGGIFFSLKKGEIAKEDEAEL